jgi:leader peptidase (prepilin peptidase)/N-methyltransferase
MSWVLFLVFVVLLLRLSWIDFKVLLLPDRLTLSLMWIGLLCNAYGIFVTPSEAILGAALGYVSFFSISRIYFYVRKKEGLGQGDAKLLGAIGAWLGWQVLPEVTLIAALLNLLWALFLSIYQSRESLKQHCFPFGPALAIAAMGIMLIQLLTAK